MKAIITCGEWFPVLTVVLDDPDKADREPMEVPDELVERYKACAKEFWDIQERLDAIYDADLYHLVATPDPSGGGEIV